MTSYIRHRLLLLLPVFFGITFFSFLLMQIPSDDAVDALYKTSGAVSEAVKAQTRAELGLDRPLLLRYWDWLSGILGGNMGRSYISGASVTEVFASRLPNTLILTVFSLAITLLVSVPLGIFAAVRHNKDCDFLIRICSFLGNSLPGFFIAFLLLYLFSLKLGWLPVLGGSDLKSFLLPALSLAVPMSAKYIRHIRASILEELNKDYVSGALVRGIALPTILYKFIMQSLGITLLTLFSISVGSLLGGTAIIETIFMIEGIGKMAMDAVLMHDYPVVQAYVVWTAVLFSCINLATDLLYHYFDPQVRLLKKDGEL